ncbi:hypothetical protein MMC14_010761 [Varicellaria rhodocarpa]|nr:hypothetical protein [Varicellaria rhodocarpa]
MSDYLSLVAKRALKAEAEEQFFPIEYLDINLSDSQNPYNIDENSFLIEYLEISLGFQGPHFDTDENTFLTSHPDISLGFQGPHADVNENSFFTEYPNISSGFQEPHIDVNANSPASLDNLSLINPTGLMQADWKPDRKRLESSQGFLSPLAQETTDLTTSKYDDYDNSSVKAISPNISQPLILSSSILSDNTIQSRCLISQCEFSVRNLLTIRICTAPIMKMARGAAHTQAARQKVSLKIRICYAGTSTTTKNSFSAATTAVHDPRLGLRVAFAEKTI